MKHQSMRVTRRITRSKTVANSYSFSLFKWHSVPHHGKTFRKIPKLTCWKFPLFELEVFPTGWIMLFRRQKSCCTESPPTFHPYLPEWWLLLWSGSLQMHCHCWFADLRKAQTFHTHSSSQPRKSRHLTWLPIFHSKSAARNSSAVVEWNLFVVAWATDVLFLHPGGSHPHLAFTDIW